MEMFKQEEITEHAIERLEELKGYYSNRGSELHNEIFNTDYYIIGTYQAKEWLGANVFEVIEIVKEYEMFNFGELTTDISNPEKLVNMYVYIVGENVLSLSDHLQQECFDGCLEDNDFDQIIEDLK